MGVLLGGAYGDVLLIKSVYCNRFLTFSDFFHQVLSFSESFETFMDSFQFFVSSGWQYFNKSVVNCTCSCHRILQAPCVKLVLWMKVESGIFIRPKPNPEAKKLVYLVWGSANYHWELTIRINFICHPQMTYNIIPPFSFYIYILFRHILIGKSHNLQIHSITNN